MPLPDKKFLRAQALAVRNKIDPAYAAQASRKISETLVKHIRTQAVIGCYSPIRGEVDITHAMERLSTDRTLCLPVIEASGQPLAFRLWKPGMRLMKGRHDILMPPANEPFVTPDTVIVPLVAFDRARHRLGFGAGYYDRTIEQLRKYEKDVEVIGVAFAVQELERIPFEPHDAMLDKVITEKEVIGL